MMLGNEVLYCTESFFYMTNIVWHLQRLSRRACGRSENWITLIRSASR